MSTCRLGNLQLTLEEGGKGTKLTLFRITGKKTSLGNDILKEVSVFQTCGSFEERKEDILCWLEANGGGSFSRLI